MRSEGRVSGNGTLTLLPILLSQRLSQGNGDGNVDMHGGGKSG